MGQARARGTFEQRRAAAIPAEERKVENPWSLATIFAEILLRTRPANPADLSKTQQRKLRRLALRQRIIRAVIQ